MFLKCSIRRKDGKEHRSWSIVESRRLADGQCVQRHVLYLGEINDSQRAAWQKSIAVFEEDQPEPVQMAIFPEDRQPQAGSLDFVQIRLGELKLFRPRQWGACWLALEIWRELHLDQFWGQRLPRSREGTRWDLVLTTLVIYRLLDPGSEWRLHREWFERAALGDLLGQDCRLVADDTLYRCLDKLVAHKDELFIFLTERWRDLFNARFDVLLYDLTSTYFECDVPEQEGLRRFGYSRDKRSDCVQVVIALILTPEGLPMGYEVLTGNTADKSTLAGMLEKIETRHGKAQRVWLMDRGIPTEEVLEGMRKSDPPVQYLVGTPKGALSKLEQSLAEVAWQQARQGIDVKLVEKEGEIYVLAKSESRISKERAMRKRRLKKLWKRLGDLQTQRNTYENLMLKLGAAKSEAGRCWGLVKITVRDLPEAEPSDGTVGESAPENPTPADLPKGLKKARKNPSPKKKKNKSSMATLDFSLCKERLRKTRRSEGRYLLRSNLCDSDPAVLWQRYMMLTQIEEAFKNIKGDLAVRPIFHQKDERIEAHVFVAFLSYCLHVTLERKLHPLAPGLTPRSVLEKFASLSLLDVHIPTTDGRTLMLTRHTEPDKDAQLLLEKLRLVLPEQPPPRIAGACLPK